MTARLREKYIDEIVDELKEELELSSVMEVPYIEKVTINMGVGEAKDNKNVLGHAREQLAAIAGQLPVTTVARRSEATFKIREDMPIGCKVTLRGERMYEFLDRFMSVALPRIRDFRGVSATSFDQQGNYAIGIAEQVIFPEVDYDDIDEVRGMDVILTIRNSDREKSYRLLEKLGMPFKKTAQATA